MLYTLILRTKEQIYKVRPFSYMVSYLNGERHYKYSRVIYSVGYSPQKTQNPKPKTQNPKPKTQNPKPKKKYRCLSVESP